MVDLMVKGKVKWVFSREIFIDRATKILASSSVSSTLINADSYLLFDVRSSAIKLGLRL